MRLRHARGVIETDRCLVMGVVNRTPDSFFDGGRMELTAAVAHALALVDEGADMLDLGGVKAGPGPFVSENEEQRRLLPLVTELAGRTDVVLSVETTRPAVARRAIDAGAALLNDVGALSDQELAAVCAATGAGLVLMHHGGQLRGRPRHPRYTDVVAAVLQEWRRLTALAARAGVDEDNLVVDPGLDFGKTTGHSLELMHRFDELVAFGRPVLVAPSHKDVVGETLGLPPQQRLEGTLALVALAVHAGAAMVRVHDVAAAVRVVRMTEAVGGVGLPLDPVRGLWD